MKLNYRDRIMLTIVIVILVWAVGIMFFIKPSIEAVQDSQAALDDAKAQRATLQARVDEDADLPERIEKAYKEVTKMTESFYDIQLKNLNMNITDYSVMTLNPYKFVSSRPQTEIDKTIEAYKNNEAMAKDDVLVTPTNAEANVDENGEVTAAPALIGYYNIEFEFEGKLDDFEAFCEKMKNENEEKTMFIGEMDYEFVKEESKSNDGKEEAKLSETDITGKMTLQMMVVEKLPDPNTLAEPTPADNAAASDEAKESADSQ